MKRGEAFEKEFQSHGMYLTHLHKRMIMGRAELIYAKMFSTCDDRIVHLLCALQIQFQFCILPDGKIKLQIFNTIAKECIGWNWEGEMCFCFACFEFFYLPRKLVSRSINFGLIWIRPFKMK